MQFEVFAASVYAAEYLRLHFLLYHIMYIITYLPSDLALFFHDPCGIFDDLPLVVEPLENLLRRDAKFPFE